MADTKPKNDTTPDTTPDDATVVALEEAPTVTAQDTWLDSSRGAIVTVEVDTTGVVVVDDDGRAVEVDTEATDDGDR